MNPPTAVLGRDENPADHLLTDSRPGAARPRTSRPCAWIRSSTSALMRYRSEQASAWPCATTNRRSTVGCARRTSNPTRKRADGLPSLATHGDARSKNPQSSLDGRRSSSARPVWPSDRRRRVRLLLGHRGHRPANRHRSLTDLSGPLDWTQPKRRLHRHIASIVEGIRTRRKRISRRRVKPIDS